MKSNKVLIFGILKIVSCQVNQEIYSEEDLLAIDSEIHNEVVVAFAPPPSVVLQLQVQVRLTWNRTLIQ